MERRSDGFGEQRINMTTELEILHNQISILLSSFFSAMNQWQLRCRARERSVREKALALSEQKEADLAELNEIIAAHCAFQPNMKTYSYAIPLSYDPKTETSSKLRIWERVWSSRPKETNCHLPASAAIIEAGHHLGSRFGGQAGMAPKICFRKPVSNSSASDTMLEWTTGHFNG